MLTLLQSNVSSVSCSKVLNICTKAISYIGTLLLCCTNNVYITEEPRDVKMQNILLTAKGVLKLGKPKQDSISFSEIVGLL